MPLKPRTPSKGEQESPSQAQSRTVSQERDLPIPPELKKRIDRLIAAASVFSESYATLVIDRRERAIRGLMLNKMFKEESLMRQTERQLPLAKQWLDAQTPL
jgi:hypothetical protein